MNEGPLRGRPPSVLVVFVRRGAGFAADEDVVQVELVEAVCVWPADPPREVKGWAGHRGLVPVPRRDRGDRPPPASEAPPRSRHGAADALRRPPQDALELVRLAQDRSAPPRDRGCAPCSTPARHGHTPRWGDTPPFAAPAGRPARHCLPPSRTSRTGSATSTPPNSPGSPAAGTSISRARIPANTPTPRQGDPKRPSTNGDPGQPEPRARLDRTRRVPFPLGDVTGAVESTHQAVDAAAHTQSGRVRTSSRSSTRIRSRDVPGPLREVRDRIRERLAM